MRHLLIAAILVLPGVWPAAAPQGTRPTAPETFKANAQVVGGPGAVAAVLEIRIERYTSDADHELLHDALAEGGEPAFVEALRKAPAIGTVKIGDRSTTVRWAREDRRPDGSRRIALATEAPIFFIGAGDVNAPSTAGYDVALFEFTVDSVGLGKGTMAPAARVKAGGASGVELEDYAGKRVTLVTVTRELS